mmetsp:Transcript_20438/g.44584  ORF Transcript_20438/g.44584 Transcript_20438/m.44584 type:complete len:293 (-) Transcript_20438:369-1247(-)
MRDCGPSGSRRQLDRRSIAFGLSNSVASVWVEADGLAREGKRSSICSRAFSSTSYSTVPPQPPAGLATRSASARSAALLFAISGAAALSAQTSSNAASPSTLTSGPLFLRGFPARQACLARPGSRAVDRSASCASWPQCWSSDSDAPFWMKSKRGNLWLQTSSRIFSSICFFLPMGRRALASTSSGSWIRGASKQSLAPEMCTPASPCGPSAVAAVRSTATSRKRRTLMWEASPTLFFQLHGRIAFSLHSTPSWPSGESLPSFRSIWSWRGYSMTGSSAFGLMPTTSVRCLG